MISLRAYARLRGVTVAAVSKAIKAGRLTEVSVVYDDKGRPKIRDVDAADREWEANTDKTWHRDRQKISQAQRQTKAAAKQEAAPQPADAGGVAGMPSYAASRAVKEAYLARLAKLDYEEKAGKLVRVDDVKIAAFKQARTVRDNVLALAGKLAAELAAETDADKVNEMLTRALTEALSELAGGYAE